jgi:hypothetical protein
MAKAIRTATEKPLSRLPRNIRGIASRCLKTRKANHALGENVNPVIWHSESKVALNARVFCERRLKSTLDAKITESQHPSVAFSYEAQIGIR